ncbi:hypothetical protein RFW95_16380, partial [Acinetobacter baumannii]|nr:hypothetical protein [Acinetobacter baumannii]
TADIQNPRKTAEKVEAHLRQFGGATSNRTAGVLFMRLNPASYQDFVDLLYSDLDGILREIQASRKLTVKKYPDVNS